MSPQPGFSRWFETICGWRPHDWQTALGAATECDNRLIRIPTGMGKTDGVLAAWLFHALHPGSVGGTRNEWPRRLVWCLPMRVLVEQTAERCRAMIDRWVEWAGVSGDQKPRVYLLMGGEDLDRWWLHPERHAVLIGTQDMLLSRALNRGYASGRARWPMEYALLNQDCLWVMDEVQLMDVGLATSAQLQAFRDQDRDKQLRPCFTWWMSATLQADWLDTVDTHGEVVRLLGRMVQVPADKRKGGLWQIRKPCRIEEIVPERKGSGHFDRWADVIFREHREAERSSGGRVTLVMVNRVDTAQEIYAALQNSNDKTSDAPDVHLIHSRFRGLERQEWSKVFLNREHCEDPKTNMIVVATQVVEAGVDITATVMITELAPWPSLVQRFGRAARYGGTAQVVVVDSQPDKKSASLYDVSDIDAAREALQELDDVSIGSLEDFEHSLRKQQPDQLARLYRYDYVHLLTRPEFDELFDTSPDLSGADLDVSRFIRSGEERDVYVCWVDEDHIDSDTRAPTPDIQPLRGGLCPVPVYRVHKWLFQSGRLKDGCSAWYWDYLGGAWQTLRPEGCYPGQVILVVAGYGGYTPDRGFTGEKRKKKELPVSTAGGYRTAADAEFADDAQARDDRSRGDRFRTIATHGRDVADVVEQLARAMGVSKEAHQVLQLAALWHDWGKAHAAFQCNIRLGETDPPRHDFAKAPRWLDYRSSAYGWPERAREQKSREGILRYGRRRGFRHELASTLALFELMAAIDRYHDALLGPYRELVELGVLTPPVVEPSTASETLVGNSISAILQDLSAEAFNLLAYLICCHHGKVRGQWQATPHDQDFPANDDRLVGCGLPIRGIRDGDPLPSITLFLPDGSEAVVPELTLHLDAAAAGLSSRYGPGWTDRVQQLLHRWGPTTLALLETILRVADGRGSQVNVADPKLAEGATA